MLRVPLNLASRPFFNNRKFYAATLLLGLVLVGLSAANLLLYLAHRSQSLRLNRELADQTAEAGRLEQEQQDHGADGGHRSGGGGRSGLRPAGDGS